jgi:hypothetical protein
MGPPRSIVNPGGERIVASRTQAAAPAEAWPELRLDGWRDTYATLHLWAQIVGKTALSFAPMQNHWWQVALHPTARGLIAPAMPAAGGMFDVEFDFVDHRLIVRTSAGAERNFPLEPRSVAAFYAEYRGTLADLGIVPHFRAQPSEMVEAIPFADDHAHAAYDADAAQRCWRILTESARVLREFRSRFVGKSSPVHFWWGGFDLACTRFSGRPAPPHPGGFPNLPDWVTREAYSHECISAGWWPGTVGGPVAEPAFYAYAYPEPKGCPAAVIRPSAAAYRTELGEWILPYEAVRGAAHPDAMLLEFLQSTYEAAAALGAWDRGGLERGASRPAEP